MIGTRPDRGADRGIRSLVIAVVLCAATPAVAQTMAGPSSVAATPHAVRGGVLMLPLTAERHGTHWPSSLTLRLDDGRVLEGIVAWVHPLPPPTQLRWTGDPRGLGVRAVAPGDDSTRDGAPYLLARLPDDASGPLRLGRQVMQPRWLDAAPITGAVRPVLARVAAPDRPDPESPFEYWRWVLLARNLDREPPPAADYGPVAGLVAEHYAYLWQAGLGRLAAANRRVRQRAVRTLTVISADGTQPAAAWVADPVPVGRLLEMLLDDQLGERELVLAANRWIDDHALLAFRVTPGAPDTAVAAVVSRDERPVEAIVRWLGSSALAEVVSLDPGVIRQVRIPIPHDEGEPTVKLLLVEAAGRISRLVFPTGAVAARPPGVGFGLRPPLTLADAETGRSAAIDPARVTTVQLRRRMGRWEIFAECRRPPIDQAAMPRPGLGRPIEEISLLVGPDPPTAVLMVPETGRYRLQRGVDDGTLEVHRHAYDDRWLCRVVLPESWLASPDGTALIGAIRRHGDSDAVETGPFASLPWAPAPGRAAVDLTTWDDLPGPE